MSAREKWSKVRLLRRARRYIQRRWGCKEYVVYFKSPTEPEPGADRSDDRLIFRVARPEDIPWMSQYLGKWASWCHDGKEVPSAEPILREQLKRQRNCNGKAEQSGF